MFRRQRWIASAVVLLIAASNTGLQAQVEMAPADTTVVPGSIPAVGAPPPGNTPLDREVAAVRESFRTRLAELTAHYAAAPDAQAAAAAQHEIAALKMQLEIDMLSIQLRLARERDDTAAIAELEQTLTVARERLVADTGLAPTPATPGNATR